MANTPALRILAARDVPPGPRENSGCSRAREHILILEPDRGTAESVAVCLSALGHAITVHRTASQGYAELERRRFGALILSASLCELDGFDVCRQVRRRSNLAIVMLTKAGDDLDRIVGLELGADDCLSKPIALGELVARLRAVMRRRCSALDTRQEPMKFGRLRIDRDRRAVLIDEQEIPLTDQQYLMLEIFALHAGKIITRDELIGFLGGEHTAAFDRSVDV